MNVLFYGGCHAVALSRLFEASAVGKHRFSSLQNFELINSGTPFPFDRLPQYDAVVYSPVRNKGEWNTSILKARCDEQGIRTVSFPWLQWNGYFPDVGDAERPPHLWTYRRLAQLAAEGAGIEALRQVAHDPVALDPLGYREYAFTALAEHEGDLDFQIGGYVREHFQQHRLFWTPNHPSLKLYEYVGKQIAQRLEIPLNASARQQEPHADALTILPGVARALGLGFKGEEYRLEHPPGAPLHLDGFLALTVQLFGKAVAATGA